MKSTLKSNLSLCAGVILALTFFSCKKVTITTREIDPNTGKTITPVDTTTTTTVTDPTSIVGKWTLISDSVTVEGNYTVNGEIPVTGNLPAADGDYFEFMANGDFQEVWYGMAYPYPCTYKLSAANVLTTNNAYAPLTNATVTISAHSLVITGKNSSATGSTTSIFYLKR
ncbi:hypothetical protein SAMN05216464_11961 [Mucilaginibacter pineti]|uniref:Lipocalin-like domain-containing protein n=1 Tax=Mucilaginibacter pineti TaxID=1391627 RepID=A0A1G7LPT9_9SPHI|nr:hypothetical protein [Mucilaginibacter pineti]SDF51386.1 hypothetical protein SAMN05216464_11961 [Mucilaginibacter pineti]